MGSVLRLLADHGPAFGQALLLTWKLTALSFVAGFLLGIVVTVARLLPLRPLRFVLTIYVEVFRNIPGVALLVFIVFALPDRQVVIDYEPAVVLTLALVCSAFTSDYLRTGINTVAGGQVDAARSLGMSPMVIVSSIVLPQALRITIPPLTNRTIAITKGTALGSVVAVSEILAQSQSAVSFSSNPSPLTLGAAAYLVLFLPVVAFGRWIETRFRA